VSGRTAQPWGCGTGSPHASTWCKCRRFQSGAVPGQHVRRPPPLPLATTPNTMPSKKQSSKAPSVRAEGTANNLSRKRVQKIMLIEVKVPQLSESVAEATLLKWHKQAGESVARDENLIDIETDKVVLELPAPDCGRPGQDRQECNGAVRRGGRESSRPDRYRS
jgi:hypothetical protein